MIEAKIKFKIKSRWLGKILFEGEYTSIKECLRNAVLSGADLRGAALRNAVLRYAVLRDADLSGADLSGADLSGADLRNADLSDTDLSNADLSNADLRDVVLSDAVLRYAVLRDADLRNADLRDAVLSDADLRGAVLSGVPSILNIHKTIYEIVSKPNALDMSTWHTCATTHCRAGWVVHLAGEAGAAMEFCMGTPAAAALIYLKSDPDLEKIPNFYANNEQALADMKRLAEAA